MEPIIIQTNYAPVEIAGALTAQQYTELTSGYFYLFTNKLNPQAKGILVANTVETAINSLYVLPKKEVMPSTLNLHMLAGALANSLTIGDLEWVMDKAKEIQEVKRKLDETETVL